MGEYAQMYIDENIHTWRGGFNSYDSTSDKIVLKPEIAAHVDSIYKKYNFLITTNRRSDGRLEIGKTSFGRNLLRFFHLNEFLTKKQLETAENCGDGKFVIS